MFAIHTTNTCTHILQTSTKQAKKYTDQLLVCVVVRHVRVREKETLETKKTRQSAKDDDDCWQLVGQFHEVSIQINSCFLLGYCI